MAKVGKYTVLRSTSKDAENEPKHPVQINSPPPTYSESMPTTSLSRLQSPPYIITVGSRTVTALECTNSTSTHDISSNNSSGNGVGKAKITKKSGCGIGCAILVLLIILKVIRFSNMNSRSSSSSSSSSISWGYSGSDSKISSDRNYGDNSGGSNSIISKFDSWSNNGSSNSVNGSINNTFQDPLLDESPCSISPCQNGGKCFNSIGDISYTCSCSHGYTGFNCETNMDSCSSSPCQNGGTCKPLDQSHYTCKCPSCCRGRKCEHRRDTWTFE